MQTTREVLRCHTRVTSNPEAAETFIDSKPYLFWQWLSGTAPAYWMALTSRKSCLRSHCRHCLGKSPASVRNEDARSAAGGGILEFEKRFSSQLEIE